ncbi:MAG: type I-D CRISPR-associated protein Cas7/Csc2 [Candidatus Poribacteria bacterium]|nr:type I-D CRISPR-associated protein Cas7/Csc2 [Candidatus Poribacteria bacterium]
MSILDNYTDFMVEKYENFPQSRYLTLIVLRKAESEMIFRTEGSGEGLARDTVYAGLEDRDEPISRVTISKRKQTAVERRTGRELLRQNNLLFYAAGEREGDEDDICALNRNKPCGICADCMIYGYAVGGGGAQKSRVITDDAFSILSYQTVTAKRTFNALYDNNTMRDPVTGDASSSIQEDEYVKPETLFIDMQTLKDLTAIEIRYVIANILRSRRYGAISSRLGKMQNMLVGAIFSDCELFSNLELTQSVYDRLGSNGKKFPLDETQVKLQIVASVADLSHGVIGNLQILSDTDLEALINEIQQTFVSPTSVKSLLESITNLYA